MKFVDEFKEFIARGNVMDMAVGIVVGGAFTSIVKSLVDDIINPFIAYVISLISTGIKSASSAAGADTAAISDAMDMSKWTIGSTGINIGNFIAAIINFLILAFIIFCAVKGLNKLHERLEKKKEEKEALDPAPTQEELLAEIRDLLKENK